MAETPEEILRAVETLQGLLGKKSDLVLDPTTKVALQAVLPGVRQAANIGTAQGRSTVKLGEQQATEGIRIAREGRKRIEKDVAEARVRLKAAADEFSTAKFSGNASRSLIVASENFVRVGGTAAVADAFVDEATEKRRAKFTGEQRAIRLKKREKAPGTRAARVSRARLADVAASRTSQLGKLTELGLSEGTRIPGGGTLGQTLTKSPATLGEPSAFREALQGAQKKIKGRKSLGKGALIGGAGAVGISLLLKLIGGGKPEVGADLPPELQLQLAQSLAGGAGGGQDPAIGTGRDLRNVFKLLQIIKTITDMQGVVGQPGTGALV